MGVTDLLVAASSRRGHFVIRIVAIAIGGCGLIGHAMAMDAVSLSDRASGISLSHSQQWGELGIDTAAAQKGRGGSPLRIGERTFATGLGHHANGEIAIGLQGHYAEFRAWVGVQWQGGRRGSVVFRVVGDGQTLFEAGPMSDSDPAKRVEVGVKGVRELRLIAGDGGDGIACDMANWADAVCVRDPNSPVIGEARITANGREAIPSDAAAGGLSVVAPETGPQMLLLIPQKAFLVDVRRDEEVVVATTINNLKRPLKVMAQVEVEGSGEAEVAISAGEGRAVRRLLVGESADLVAGPATSGAANLTIAIKGLAGETVVRLRDLRFSHGDEDSDLRLQFGSSAGELPPPELANFRPALERHVIEWDWRMQDGIGTPREERTWAQATDLTLSRGDRLIRDLARSRGPSAGLMAEWKTLRRRYEELTGAGDRETERIDLETEWEKLWRRAHEVRRAIAFSNPLAKTGPVAFVKNVPSAFSHQLTQYSGRCARPGGGIFVLDAPGDSMAARRLSSLPVGSCQNLDVSWDGREILFSFCRTEEGRIDWRTNATQFYHLFSMAADGSGLRQLTEGSYDDFAPRELPDGNIVFLSTRRGGFHRCGRGPCPVYTLAIANRDGGEPRVISFHETHEWDPAVMNDGRIIYTRWDYVDRHAVHYQQLWTARPDGTGARAFYGNNTLNPVGVWEARAIPNSNRIMATAAAHHAMTAGSIILLDVTRGVDGLEPISRLTRDALFPESESAVQRWHAVAGVTAQPRLSAEERRWPGHCYRTPCPLSEDYFLVSYSFEPLVGEPEANRPNMFGIYLADRFGNKELIYRDVSIGSLWAMPLRARQRPPAMLSTVSAGATNEGTFFMQDVDESWPQLAEERGVIKELRILQVLPKTTPHANSPRVGLANASPGKQVLGTVPVESDGSAYFRAPAGIPLAFQALDEHGMAVQTMRSVTYLQPGEQASCIGCHEQRVTAPQRAGNTLASRRAPSTIKPGPEGSKPFNYAILVQPVLDRHCIRCHSPPGAKGGIDLTGTPSGEFTASYLALAPRVRYSEWKSTPQANSEPMTHPDLFGARSSPLMTLIQRRHNDVALSDDELRRLATWMDANALFYGTFDLEDQKRQRRGELIAGPALE